MRPVGRRRLGWRLVILLLLILLLMILLLLILLLLILLLVLLFECIQPIIYRTRIAQQFEYVHANNRCAPPYTPSSCSWYSVMLSGVVRLASVN